MRRRKTSDFLPLVDLCQQRELGLSLLGNVAYCTAAYMLVEGNHYALNTAMPPMEAWRFYLYSSPVPALGFFLTVDSCC